LLKVTIPNPEHLFQQAEQLVRAPVAGRPRQVDLRRAISTAYYAVFHATLTAAADNFIGRNARASSSYRLAYRSVNHRNFRELCKAFEKGQLAPKYREYAPTGGFGPEIRALAAAVVDLQLRREAADYDPFTTFKPSDARLVINLGREALMRFEAAPTGHREAFLGLLLFSPR
jgi:hypothetical protein